MRTARVTDVKMSHTHRPVILSGPISKDVQVVLKYEGAQPQTALIEYLSIMPKAIEATIRWMMLAPLLARGWKMPR